MDATRSPRVGGAPPRLFQSCGRRLRARHRTPRGLEGAEAIRPRRVIEIQTDSDEHSCTGSAWTVHFARLLCFSRQRLHLHLMKAGIAFVAGRRWTVINFRHMYVFLRQRSSLPPLRPLLRYTQAPRLLLARDPMAWFSRSCRVAWARPPRGQRLWWCG
ncbi:hypothetical protein EDD16DRAFT_1561053 [Pisolithus croceorrhizus]|nr:hypothetical protein EDD16DRAFT_1561053 [Pisolithus croceorrhizus]